MNIIISTILVKGIRRHGAKKKINGAMFDPLDPLAGNTYEFWNGFGLCDTMIRHQILVLLAQAMTQKPP